MWDPTWICNLCCRLWQCQILKPLNKSRDWTHGHYVGFLTSWANNRNSKVCIFKISWDSQNLHSANWIPTFLLVPPGSLCTLCMSITQVPLFPLSITLTWPPIASPSGLPPTVSHFNFDSLLPYNQASLFSCHSSSASSQQASTFHCLLSWLLLLLCQAILGRPAKPH